MNLTHNLDHPESTGFSELLAMASWLGMLGPAWEPNKHTAASVQHFIRSTCDGRKRIETSRKTEVVLLCSAAGRYENYK